MIRVGDTVRHIDANRPGTVVRIIGQRGVGGGQHARVSWATGGSGVVRLDLLVVLHRGE